MAVQRGRSERRGEAYSVPYVEPLSDARTKLADFFSILLVEYDRFPAIHEHAMFDMPPHGAGQHDFLQIPALADEILDRIPVTDPDHILFDDRPFVQILCGVVRSRPDDLDPTVIGLPIGIRTDEGGEE